MKDFFIVYSTFFLYIYFIIMMVYNFKDCHVYTYQFKSYNSNHKLRTLRLNNHINDIPKNQNQVYQLLFNKIKLITLASYTASTMYDTIQLKDGLNNNRIANAGFVGEYIDKNNKFSLTIPPAWIITPKNTPTPTMLKYQTEEPLFIASSFVEACSMSITKTNAPRLLKDFDIEWWFAPLNKLTDLGSAELITKLLILQRQGEFEKKITPSEILISEFTNDNTTLQFDFKTPLKEGIERRTIGKAYLRESSLYVIWLSGLTSVIEGDYRETLNNIRDSFQLIISD